MSPRRVLSLAGTVALAAMLAIFAVAHLQQWHETGRPVGLGLTLLSALTMILVVTRRTPLSTSSSARAWVVAPIGSFAMLGARPADGALIPAAASELIQLAGLLLALAGLGALGRSFGVVAANRGVKTNGVYRFVRHPLYASYLLVDVGYVLANPSGRNLSLACLATGFQLLRIREEERLLTGDDSYRRYCRDVRYRLVPGLF